MMHPGPMVRGMEITADVADSDRSVIVEQVTNGVAVRMAVLYLLLSGAESTTSRGDRRMSTGYLIRNVSILGADPTDLVLRDGVVSRAASAAAPRASRRSTAPG